MSQLLTLLAAKPVFSKASYLLNADSVTALAYDKINDVLAVANGNSVDYFVRSGNSWAVIYTDPIGSGVTGLSFYRGQVIISTATETIYKPNYKNRDQQVSLGVVSVDTLISSTNEDSNPDWPSEVTASYQTEPESPTRGPGANFPRDFIVLAETNTVTIYDVGSGVPLMWMVFVNAGTNILANDPSSLSYSDGCLFWGKTMQGNTRTSFALDDSFGWRPAGAVGRGDYLGTIAQRNDGLGHTGTSPEIVSEFVNDIASAVLNSVTTTNLLSATDNPATQSVTTVAATYTLGFDGEGSAVLSGTATGTLDGATYPQQTRQWLTFDATAGSLTLTLSGDVRNIQLEQSSAPHDYVPSVTGPTSGQTPPASQLRNRTNLITHSNDFANAAWEKIASGAAILPSVTQSNETAPSGEQATRLECRGVSAATSDFSLIQQTTGNASSPHTASIWMRSNTGENQSVYLRVIGTDNSSVVTVTAEWQRYSVSDAFSTAADVYITVGARSQASGSQQVDVLIASSQLEPSTYPTPYIPTTDTAATVTDDYGLFIPDWAVATDGGVSVGLDSGAVNDSDQLAPYQNVDFASNGLFYGRNFNTRLSWTSNANLAVNPFLRDINYAVSGEQQTPPLPEGTPRFTVTEGDTFVVGTEIGPLTIVDQNVISPNQADYTLITSTYNTGFMVSPDGAWANDSGTDPIGFPWDLYKDFNAPNVEIFRDEFNRTDPAPWVVSPNVSIVNGALDGNEPASSVLWGRIDSQYQSGKWYRTTFEVTRFNSGAFVILADGQQQSFSPSSVGVYEFYILATGATGRLQLNTSASGADGAIDNVLIEEVPALDGWGVANDAALSIVNGELRVEKAAGDAFSARAVKSFPVTPNTNYVCQVENTSRQGGSQWGISETTAIGSALTSQLFTGVPQVSTASFNSGANSSLLVLLLTSTTTGSFATYDNLTVQESLLTNPTFDSDLSGWAPGAGWTWGTGGYLQATAVAPGVDCRQNIAIPDGEWVVEIKIENYSAGGVRFKIGPDPDALISPDYSADGVYKFSFTAAGRTNIQIQAVAGIAATLDVSYVILSAALPDNSGQGNDAVAGGTVTREEYEGSGVYGVCINDNNYVQLDGTGILSGYVRYGKEQWKYFGDASELKYAEITGSFIRLRGGTGLTDNPTCYAFLALNGAASTVPVVPVARPDGEVLGFGGIPTKDSTDAPDYYDRGLPFDDGGLLAVDDVSPISRYHQGLPFTANGRLATNSLAPPTRFGNGGAPFGEEGRLCLNANTADHYLAAVPYNADSSVTEA